MRRITFITAFMLYQISQGQAPRIKSIGLPVITSYSQADYDFTSHNYCLVIGDDQKIYFGNDKGVLVYDGARWSKVYLPGEVPVYSMVKGPEGTIFLGAVNQFGYLSADKSGNLEYISLRDKFEGSIPDRFTGRCWRQGDQIYVGVGKNTFSIDIQNDKYEVIKGPGVYRPQVAGDRVFALGHNEVFEFVKGKWELYKKTELIDDRTFGQGRIMDYQGKPLAITTDGFFDLENEQKITISPELESFLANAAITYVNMLANEYFIISTFNGLMITDTNGNPVMHLDKARGLPDEFTFQTELDRSGMLWVATYGGVAKIDIFSPFSVFDQHMNISGVVKDVQLHKNDLYVSTVSGVLKEDWEVVKNAFYIPQFKMELEVVSHQMINEEDDLIIGTETDPNYALYGGEFRQIPGTRGTIYWCGFKYKDSKDLLYGSFSGVLAHISKVSNQWAVVETFDPQFTVAESIVEGEGNDVWISSIQEGIYKIEYDREERRIISDTRYGVEHGLPSNLNNWVFQLGGKPCFVTIRGVYRFDEENSRFIKDPEIGALVGDVPALMIEEDEKGNIYYYADEFVMLRKTPERYEKIPLRNLDMKRYAPSDITVIDSKNIFLSGLDAIIHVDPSTENSYESFNVRINQLSLIDNDSVVFGGFGQIPEMSLDPSDNAIRFEFASTFHQNSERTEYKWKLDGMEDDWSSWSISRTKDYTNLGPGDYRFQVVARNIHQQESPPTAIVFSISTPWFLTFWALLFYGLSAIGLVYFIVFLNSRRLKATNVLLEEKVADRTNMINEQKNKLVEMDDLKRRFFVNISHELRTPLTLVMGTVDQALAGKYGLLNDALYANLKISRRNNERLLKMVNSILDISKLEGGRIQLFARKQDPTEVINKVLAFFSSRFEDRRIKLKTDLVAGLEVYLDDDRFETIIINLLSNAFKFSKDGGEIEVSLKNQPSSIAITVKDSGEGIPEKDLDLVFDRFYQSPTLKSGEGIGVGLALTKELVELHGGSITARNNQGAEFKLEFPKGADHLTPNQIVEGPRETTDLRDKYPLNEHQKQEINLDDSASHAEHILLVEDNPEMAQFVAEILNGKYKVSHVLNGKEGLNFLEEERPDLIVTDYLMPEMDGFEMAVEIKKNTEFMTLPIIFLTARTREQDKINVLNLGVDDYLFKPFNTDELLVRVKNLLYMKKQRSEYVLEESIDPRDIEWRDFPSKLKLKVDEYLESHIKEEIKSEYLAEYTNQSERTLYRKIKVNTGLSVMGYVKEYRLRKARTLLELNELQTVSEVAYEVGFNYLSHFTKNYTERFGKNPSEYL